MKAKKTLGTLCLLAATSIAVWISLPHHVAPTPTNATPEVVTPAVARASERPVVRPKAEAKNVTEKFLNENFGMTLTKSIGVQVQQPTENTRVLSRQWIPSGGPNPNQPQP